MLFRSVRPSALCSVQDVFLPWEHSSRQSICAVALVHDGFDALRSKTLSVATPCGFATGFLVVNLYFGKDLGRCAAPRPQTGLPAACWGRSAPSCPDAPPTQCPHLVLTRPFPPGRMLGLQMDAEGWASKLCLSTHVRARSPQVHRMSTIRRRLPPGGRLQCWDGRGDAPDVRCATC